MTAGDPISSGQTVGKAKRLRAVLNWAVENDPGKGGKFAITLLGVVKGSGGFREDSPNYVGDASIIDARDALASDGYVLEMDGSLRPLLLDALSGAQLSKALEVYVRRAKRGATDAALVTGTGKDLLEATAKHVLVQKFGVGPTTLNFPTVLAQAFMAAGLAVSREPTSSANQRLEAALFELGCAVNALRNATGTGHGRPFLPSVNESEARAAIEAMGVISERLLASI